MVPDPGTPRVEGSFSNRHMVLRSAATLMVAVVAFGVVLPRIVDYGEVASEIRRLSGAELLILATIAMLRWGAMGGVYASVTPGLGLPKGLQTYLCCNSVMSVVPGPVDLAVRYRLFRRAGIESQAARASVIAAGFFTYSSKLMLPVVAAIVALTARSHARWQVAAISVGALLALTVLVAVVRRMTRRAGHRIADELDRAAHVVTLRWRLAMAAQVAAFTTSILLLVLCLRFVGVGNSVVGFSSVLTGFAVVEVVALVPISNANIGIAELVLIGSLARSQDTRDAVVAAIFVYRFFAFFLAIPVGAVLLGAISIRGRARGT